MPEDDVDPTQQLTRNGAHCRAPGLALVKATLEVSGEVRIQAARRDGGQPQRSPEVRRTTLGHMSLRGGELAGREGGRIDTGVAHQTLEATGTLIEKRRIARRVLITSTPRPMQDPREVLGRRLLCLRDV